MQDFFAGKNVLISGAAGTVGQELVEKLLSLNVSELRLLDNNETELFYLMEKYVNQQRVTCFLGDIRDRDKIHKLTNGVDIIFHTAAFKHVLLSEYNPFDVVQTNVHGVQNIIWAAINCNVKKVIFTSSDKAVNPTNVMGTTKLLGEKLMTAANIMRYQVDTVFCSTRFGNVVGSRGSVVPVFMKQIRDGGPVTITDRKMTRFIMTAEEAVRLVLKTAIISKCGEVFVTKMLVVRIEDLAEIMVEILASRYGYKPSDIKIVEIGAKPGEKFYEELLSEEEVHRSIELKDMFVITPAFKTVYKSIRHEYPDTVSDKVDKTYISDSEKPISKEELKQYLIKNKVLEKAEKSL